MKKTINFIAILLVFFILVGCNSNHTKEEELSVQDTVSEFSNQEEAIVSEDLEDNAELIDVEAIEEKQEEVKEEKKTVSNQDITEMYFWVVTYDQFGNEVDRYTSKYGSTVYDPSNGKTVIVKGNTKFYVTIDYSSPSDKDSDTTPSITKYTLTFDVQGKGTAPSQLTVSSGSKVTKPADPTYTGYALEGWYKEPACTNKWDFDTDTVSANTTLYAKWITALSDKILKAKTIYTDGESACASDSTNSVININGIDCYVLQVDSANNKAELITKGIYDTRFYSTSTGAESEYKYSTSDLKTWMDNFYSNNLSSKDGTDYIILDSTITYYYKDSYDINLDNYSTGTLTQKVFPLDAKEAKSNASKFGWNDSDGFIGNPGVGAYGFWVSAGYSDSGYSKVFRVLSNSTFSNSTVDYAGTGARPTLWISLY